jgi:soluble lytic murein transglycosylase-like protein
MSQRSDTWLYWGMGITGLFALLTFRPKTSPPKPLPKGEIKSVAFQVQPSGMLLVQSAKDVAWNTPKLKPETQQKFQAMVQNWKEWVDEAVLDYRVPESWIWAIMWSESQGNPEAKSKAGALGLMQVMPFHFKQGEEPFNPRTNIRAGVRYLQEIRGKVNNLVQAASMYNAGGPWTNESWIASGRNASYTTTWGFPAERGYIDTVVAANNTFLSMGLGIITS